MAFKPFDIETKESSKLMKRIKRDLEDNEKRIDELSNSGGLSMQANISNCGNYIIIIAFTNGFRVKAIDCGDGWINIDDLSKTAGLIISNCTPIEEKEVLSIVDYFENLSFGKCLIYPESGFWNF